MKMRFVRVKAGQFTMGSARGDPYVNHDELPAHHVRVGAFSLGVNEVPRGQFRVFAEQTGYKTDVERNRSGSWGWNAKTQSLEENPKYNWRYPGFVQTDDHPVVNVSWNDARAFLDWLSRLDRIAYRLPTEAEWECACRAGSETTYHFGNDPEAIAAFGNIADRALKRAYSKLAAIATRDG
jgi:formylglycine-generating enzyme required for sulfatase activity